MAPGRMGVSFQNGKPVFNILLEEMMIMLLDPLYRGNSGWPASDTDWRRHSAHRGSGSYLLPSSLGRTRTACSAGSVVVALLPGVALRIIFALFLVFVPFRMLAARRSAGADLSVCNGAYRAAGAAIGMAEALIGAGGGVFMVPWLSGRGRTKVRAVTTSATVGLPVTVLGVVFHALCPLGGIDASMLGRFTFRH